LRTFSIDVARGHFDMKPENVLVVSNGVDSPDWLFKFADFGFSSARDGGPQDRLPKANEMKDAPTYG
jgi:serine/threonine protein kinase